ncbi:hypothetical protein DITRI_Ditri07aG0001600 [Diplodiscus trichospermus]
MASSITSKPFVGATKPNSCFSSDLQRLFFFSSYLRQNKNLQKASEELLSSTLSFGFTFCVYLKHRTENYLHFEQSFIEFCHHVNIVLGVIFCFVRETLFSSTSLMHYSDVLLCTVSGHICRLYAIFCVSIEICLRDNGGSLMLGSDACSRYGSYEIQAAGSTFGTYFRVTTFGESHGGGVACIVDGCPPRIPLSEADLQVDLDRRRPGQSRITTPRKETDTCRIYSGVSEGVTTGNPIHVFVPNTDQRGHDYKEMSIAYRPSHANATYDMKYGVRAVQGGGRSSARETIGRVASGAIAKKILKQFSGTELFSGAFV